tara:strand:- start:546 stop:866 length:321 start_codon:yes stop_codon:yes gene_type:complete
MPDANGGAQNEGAAEQWFAVMRSGAPSPAEVVAFQEWRAADPDHARAYDALEDAWARAGDHADHPEVQNMRRAARARRPKAVIGKRHILSLIALALLLGLVLSLLF